MEKARCCMCRQKGEIRTRDSWICRDCLSAFPEGVRYDIKTLRAKQLKSFFGIYSKSFSRAWFSYDGLGVTYNSVQLNGFEYPVKNIKDFKIGFHPQNMGEKPGYVKGYLSASIETKHPHAVIKEKFCDSAVVQYSINQSNIVYAIPRALVEIEKIINECNTVIKARALPSEGAKIQGLTPIEQAKSLFGITGTYTKAELTKLRNHLMTEKNIHPDDGGETEEFREFMDAYKLLLKFAKP